MRDTSFRNSASFGKRIEYWVSGLLLKDGFDVFLPLVDDDGIDMILRGADGRKLDIQVKARSKDVAFGSSALFSTGQSHANTRDDFYFIFYSERLDAIWVFSSADYVTHCVTQMGGKHVGRRQIWLNGRSKVRGEEYPNPKFGHWLIGANGRFDFTCLHNALEARQ